MYSLLFPALLRANLLLFLLSSRRRLAMNFYCLPSLPLFAGGKKFSLAVVTAAGKREEEEEEGPLQNCLPRSRKKGAVSHIVLATREVTTHENNPRMRIAPHLSTRPVQ